MKRRIANSIRQYISSLSKHAETHHKIIEDQAGWQFYSHLPIVKQSDYARYTKLVDFTILALKFLRHITLHLLKNDMARFHPCPSALTDVSEELLSSTFSLPIYILMMTVQNLKQLAKVCSLPPHLPTPKQTPASTLSILCPCEFWVQPFGLH